MYEYKFIKTTIGTFSSKPKEDYQAIIHDYAKQGWRYTTCFYFGNTISLANYTFVIIWLHNKAAIDWGDIKNDFISTVSCQQKMVAVL